MPTLQDIIDYYVNLLIMQYHDKPKAKADIENFINELFADNLVFQLERAFDIDTAIGAQLTILAKYVGAERVVRGYLVERVYFQLGDYASVANKIGVRDYTTPRPEGEVNFYSYSVNENSEYTLNDAELRFIIKLLIIRNNTTAGFKDIKETIFNFFDGELSVYDNLDMSLTYFTGENINSIINLAISQDYLPRPACVGLEVYSVQFPEKLFGFNNYDKESTNIGMGDYSIGKEGSFLSYNNLVVV